jgi:TetR/AcrR family transcriptional regulator
VDASVTKSDSRESIIRAARAEFANHGFAGARVDRIARAAGLNKQLIYYYFGSKRGLHTAATDTVPLEAAAAAVPTTATEGIRRIVDRLLRASASHPEIVSLLVDRGAGAPGAGAGRAWIAHAQQDAAAVLSRGQGLGHFRDDLDPQAAARAAVVLCLGYLALAPHLDAGLDDWSREVSDTLTRLTTW